MTKAPYAHSCVYLFWSAISSYLQPSLRDSAANTVRICIVTPHVIFSVRICKRNFTQVSVVGTTRLISVTIVFLSYKHTEEYYCLCVHWLAAGKQAYLKPLCPWLWLICGILNLDLLFLIFKLILICCVECIWETILHSFWKKQSINKWMKLQDQAPEETKAKNAFWGGKISLGGNKFLWLLSWSTRWWNLGPGPFLPT